MFRQSEQSGGVISIRTQLRDARVAAGLSQHELAQKSGYSNRSAISQIESGAMNPSMSQMRQLADVLGVAVLELFPELGHASSPPNEGGGE